VKLQIIGVIFMLLFVPLFSVSNVNRDISQLPVQSAADDISQVAIETTTTEFVDNSRRVGKITMDEYADFISAIEADGDSYDVEIEVKVLDENIGKKSEGTQETVIGENVYHSIYTSEIVETLEKDGAYMMKEGDILTVCVKNSNKTSSQQNQNDFVAQHTGIVTSNGSL